MKDPRRLIFTLLGIAVALLILRLTIFAPQPDDQKLIAQALKDSIQERRCSQVHRDSDDGLALDRHRSAEQLNQRRPARYGRLWNVNRAESSDCSKLPIRSSSERLYQFQSHRRSSQAMAFRRECSWSPRK